MVKNWSAMFVILALVGHGTWLGHNARAADNWSPLQVETWNPPFSGQKSAERLKYVAVEKASRKWNVCAVIPHLKDAYWLAVNFGLIAEARRADIRLTIAEAGGYEKLDVQRRQIDNCVEQSADALIIGSISADGLNDLVEKYTAAGKPVIDLINGISSPKITARAAVDFSEMGQLAGAYVVDAAKSAKGPVKVLWFPGPEGAGWSKAGDTGFRKGINGSNVSIADTRWGDTGVARQSQLVSEALEANPNVSFIVGTAVTAEAAVQELRRRKSDNVKVVAYYFSPPVARGIQRGNIEAAPSDVPVLQARLSVDLAIRALEKLPFPRHLAAPIQVLNGKNIGSVDISESLAPEGFRPVTTTGN